MNLGDMTTCLLNSYLEDYTSKSIKLPTGATIPDGFYKTIRYGKDNVEKYYFKNEEPKSDRYLEFKIK